MLTPDDQITTWIDVSGTPLEAKWRALQRHVTQMSPDNPFLIGGIDAWREYWTMEALVLRSSHKLVEKPEADVFAGLEPDD